MELQSSTPEIKVTDGQANSSEHVDITHSHVSVSQGVKTKNPDCNGQILISTKNAKKLGMICGLMLTILQHQQDQ